VPWALLLPFFLATLAGEGLEALLRAGATRALALTGAVLLLMLVFGTATSRAFGVLTLAGVALAARGRTPAGLVAAGVVALVVGEAIVASPFRLGADPFPPLPYSATTRALLDAVRAEPEPVRFLGAREAARGVAMLEQLDAVPGLEESVMPRRLRRIVRHLGIHVGLPEMPLRLDAIGASKPLVDLLGVAYVTGPPRWAAALEGAGMIPLRVASDGEDGLWRNPTALPRAFLVRRVRAVTDADAAFVAVSASDFRPRDEAILEQALDVSLSGAGGAGDSARVVRRSAEELVVAVEAASPALLVVTETHYPGWTARVGDAPADIHPVDFAFRGVVVPAGTSEVTFTYAPRSVAWGAGLSGIGLVLAAALWWLAPRTRPA